MNQFETIGAWQIVSFSILSCTTLIENPVEMCIFADENIIALVYMKNLKLSLFVLALMVYGSVFGQDAPATHTQVTLHTTMGDITVALYDDTPLHRDNFIARAEEGYFDSLLFHRVIRNFMVQAGDPTSRQATPGSRVGHEGPEPTVTAEFHYPQLFHKRGALAAARRGDDENPDKESSAYQFYIVWGTTFATDEQLDAVDAVMYRFSGLHMTPGMRDYYRTHPGTPHLDGSYTVFGEVVQGLDVVDRIQQSQTDVNDRPLADVRILGVSVKRQPMTNR